MKKLFLDDIRTIEMVYDASEVKKFDIVRNFKDFLSYIKKHGLPNFISFDNDLGLDENGEVAPDGYAAAKWLVYESGLDLKNLQFKVHSANPVASIQITSLLNNYQKHIRSEFFLEKVESYCKDISEQNFSRKYEGLKEIVLTHNDMGLSGKYITITLNEYLGKDETSDSVNEVVGEILSCIAGYTSPSNIIRLKEYSK